MSSGYLGSVFGGATEDEQDARSSSYTQEGNFIERVTEGLVVLREPDGCNFGYHFSSLIWFVCHFMDVYLIKILRPVKKIEINQFCTVEGSK